MKSPRQILLDRHAGALPELAAARHRFLQQLTDPREAWWTTAWREVFLAARPTWTALAALALVAIALHLASTQPRTTLHTTPLPSPDHIAEARRARAELWAEILDRTGPPITPLPTQPTPSPAKARSALTARFWPA